MSTRIQNIILMVAVPTALVLMVIDWFLVGVPAMHILFGW